MIEVKYIYDFKGYKVNEYTLKNGKFRISAINIGAAITKLIVPNRKDKFESIFLRYYNYTHYKKNKYFLGSLVNLNKSIDDHNFILNYYFVCDFTEDSLIFSYQNMDNFIKVIYRLNDQGLEISYDTNMNVNLSNGLYFNLSGNLKSSITTHQLYVDANQLPIVEPFTTEFIHLNQIEELELSYKKNGINLKLNQPMDVILSNNKQFEDLILWNKGHEHIKCMSLCLLFNATISRCQLNFNAIR